MKDDPIHPDVPVNTASGRWRRWLAEAALVVAVVAGIGFWQTRHVPAGAAPGFAAELASLSGATISLEAFRARHPGRPMLLYFWADWCPVCKVVAGTVGDIAAEKPVLTIAMQSGDTASVARFLANHGHAWTTAVDPEGRIASAYGVSGVPAFVVIDGEGRIRFAEQGYTSGAGLRLRLWWAGLGAI